MKRTSSRLGIEILESRTVPAVGLSNGVLTIDGDIGADTIVVSQAGDNVLVTLNSVNSLFTLSEVKDVRINGGLSDDTITYTLDKHVTISGGDGNDTITAGGILGGGNATIYGGDGNDTITSTATGRTSVIGGDGNKPAVMMML